MFWGTLHLVVWTFSCWSQFSNNTFPLASSFIVPFWENGLNLHIWHLVGSWKFLSLSGKIENITIHKIRDENLIILLVSWNFPQMFLIMSVTYSADLYIFSLVAMVSTASNISSLRSRPWPAIMSVIAMILATICAVRCVMWPIISPFEFFLDADPVNSSTSPSFIPTGTRYPLFDSPTNWEMTSLEMSTGWSK